MIDEKDIVVEKINKLDIHNDDVIILYIDTKKYPIATRVELLKGIKSVVQNEMGVKNPVLFLPKDCIKLSKDTRKNIIDMLKS